jgi:hypothetical protein
MSILKILIFIFISFQSEARVFSFKDADMSVYLRGTGGLSQAGSDAWKFSSGNQTFFDSKDGVDYNFSGELGFLASFKKMNIRLGFEILQTKDAKVSGNDNLAVKLMDVESRSIAFTPNVTLEFNILEQGTTRYLLFLGGGYSTVDITNRYTLTTAGTTAYGAIPDYKEDVSGKAITLEAGVGTEFLLLDNVTLFLDVGYRELSVPELYFDETIITVSGNRAKGERATKENGNPRSIDLGGAFIGLSLRFYLPPFK